MYERPIIDLFPLHFVQSLEELQALQDGALAADAVDRLKRAIEALFKKAFIDNSIPIPTNFNVDDYLLQILKEENDTIYMLLTVYQSLRSWGNRSPYFKQCLQLFNKMD